MANIKSAIKRIKVAAKRRERNRSVKSRIHTAERRFQESLQSGDIDVAREQLRVFVKTIDTAVQKGIVHGNTAARHKSRLSHAYNRAAQGS